MHINQILSLITLFFCSSTITAFAQKENNIYKPDVLSYEVVLEPDIKNKQIQGSVSINFVIDIAATTVAFDCGNLQITKVTGKAVVDYEQKNGKVIISLSDRIENENQIHIAYKGSPSRGIVFVSETEEAYTVFSTSEWMVCNNSPNDRAKFKIDLLIPSDKTC
jgi:aminopeptidase N